MIHEKVKKVIIISTYGVLFIASTFVLYSAVRQNIRFAKKKKNVNEPDDISGVILAAIKKIEKKYDKPSIFLRTIFRIPTYNEITGFENFPDLTVNEIVNGFAFTMIGNGIDCRKNIEFIISGIQMLVDRYPENKIYNEALVLAKNYWEKQGNKIIVTDLSAKTIEVRTIDIKQFPRNKK